MPLLRSPKAVRQVLGTHRNGSALIKLTPRHGTHKSLCGVCELGFSNGTRTRTDYPEGAVGDEPIAQFAGEVDSLINRLRRDKGQVDEAGLRANGPDKSPFHLPSCILVMATDPDAQAGRNAP